MQVNPPFVIKIIFQNGYTFRISSFLLYANSSLRIPALTLKEAVRYYGRPISFKVLELNVDPTSLKFINWLETEFKPLFDYDPMLWLASVGTCPELAPLLIPFHKDS